MLVNPFTRQVINADVPNPQGCNQHTGPDCSGSSSRSIYHERSAVGLDRLLADCVASGLCVSTDPDLALGQSGKGALVELSEDKVLGPQGMGRGHLRPIEKPSTGFVGREEFEVSGGRLGKEAVRSITISPGTPIDIVTKTILQRQFTKEVLKNGSVKYTPKR